MGSTLPAHPRGQRCSPLGENNLGGALPFHGFCCGCRSVLAAALRCFTMGSPSHSDWIKSHQPISEKPLDVTEFQALDLVQRYESQELCTAPSELQGQEGGVVSPPKGEILHLSPEFPGLPQPKFCGLESNPQRSRRRGRIFPVHSTAATALQHLKAEKESELDVNPAHTSPLSHLSLMQMSIAVYGDTCLMD